MKDCYHTTKIRFLSSILKNGLQSIYGDNAHLTSDPRNGNISYSVGKQGAADTFSVFNSFYCRVLEGWVDENDFKKKLSPEEFAKHQKSVEAIKNSGSFEEWVKDNIYLCFDGDFLSEKKEDIPEDSYTTQPIPAKQLKVCVIKNTKDNTIHSYSMIDIYSLFFAKDPELMDGLYTHNFSENIEKFKSDEYALEYIDLEHFCEMFPELLEDSSSRKQEKLSTSAIGKRSIGADILDKFEVARTFKIWTKQIIMKIGRVLNNDR